MSPNQISFNHFRELRVTAGLADDPDFAGLDPQQIPASGDIVVLRAPGPDPRTPVPLKVQILVEWLDVSDNVVTRGGRGSFDIQALHVSDRQSPLSGQFVTDSVLLRAQMAYRPIVIDEVMSGDSFSVRLINLVSPDATAVKARVLYREML